MTDGNSEVSVAESGNLMAVSGELDVHSCPSVRTAVLEAITTRAGSSGEGAVFDDRALLLDLSGVSFASSAALSMLLDLEARATAAPVPLVLVVPPGSFLDRLLGQTGLSETLTVAADTDAARRR